MPRSLRLVFVFCALWLGTAACAPHDATAASSPPSPGSAALSACDPFAPSPKPISLEKVIAAGRSAAGTVYVVNETATLKHRVFISNSGVLEGQRIAGSGEGPQLCAFAMTDHNPPLLLQVDLGPSGPVAMGILEGEAAISDRRTIVIGQDGERLTLLSEGDVASMPVRNLPGAQFLEYNALTSDGRALIVVRPMDDWKYEDFRVFFGEPAQLVERRVKNVSRGSYTSILFDLDEGEATALFRGLVLNGPGPSEGTLTVGGAAMELALITTSAPPAGMNYLCLGR